MKSGIILFFAAMCVANAADPNEKCSFSIKGKPKSKITALSTILSQPSYSYDDGKIIYIYDDTACAVRKQINIPSNIQSLLSKPGTFAMFGKGLFSNDTSGYEWYAYSSTSGCNTSLYHENTLLFSAAASIESWYGKYIITNTSCSGDSSFHILNKTYANAIAARSMSTNRPHVTYTITGKTINIESDATAKYSIIDIQGRVHSSGELKSNSAITSPLPNTPSFLVASINESDIETYAIGYR